MFKREPSPLLELLDQRWKEIVNGLPDPAWDRPIRRPRFAPGANTLRENAQLHAQSDSSDPFAYGRAMRRQRSGEWLPSEVRKDALAKIAANAAGHVGIIIPISGEQA